MHRPPPAIRGPLVLELQGTRHREPKHEHGGGERRDRFVPPRPLAETFDGTRPAGTNRLVVEEALEIVGQFLGGAISLSRVLGNGLEYDRFQFRGDRLVDSARRAWLVEGDAP
jgi:hypothetical protein